MSITISTENSFSILSKVSEKYSVNSKTKVLALICEDSKDLNFATEPEVFPIVESADIYLLKQYIEYLPDIIVLINFPCEVATEVMDYYSSLSMKSMKLRFHYWE